MDKVEPFAVTFLPTVVVGSGQTLIEWLTPHLGSNAAKVAGKLCR